MRRITTPIHYTYPQPAPRRAGLSTWSKFNEHRWSEFNAHEHAADPGIHSSADLPQIFARLA